MNLNPSVLKSEEKAVFGLRSLYRTYGYTQFKMNKFEEYDLYVRNKDFLVSDNVITFTDTNGKLMALKPDVTLSIIKNSTPASQCVEKLYYNENVYRVTGSSRSFREIMQVGLECIGSIDSYNIFEVLMLAAESLKSISPDCVLDISHMGIVSGLLDTLQLSAVGRKQVLKCIGEKNTHGIASVCAAEGADTVKTELLRDLVMTSGMASSVLPMLEEKLSASFPAEVQLLCQLSAGLESRGLGNVIHIDFSVVNDMNYYNGIVFKGFIRDIPVGILSGGQYDKLMEKMGHSCGGIGFAVYLDMLERLESSRPDYDVDTVVLYDEDADLTALSGTLALLSSNGLRVMAQKALPEKLRYRQLLKFRDKGVELLETNA